VQSDNDRSDTNRRSSPSARFEYLRIKDDRSKERRLSTAVYRGGWGVVDGAGCIEQGFTAYSVYPFKRRISVICSFRLILTGCRGWYRVDSFKLLYDSMSGELNVKDD
jgi:hypothetical protein